MAKSIKLLFIIVLCVGVLCGCAPHKNTSDELVFNDDGSLIDPELERTYAFPDLATFTGYNVKYNQAEAGLALELWDKKDWRLKGDIFFTTNTVGLNWSKKWTSIFEISTGVGVGYTFDPKDDEDDPGIGIIIDILIIQF